MADISHRLFAAVDLSPALTGTVRAVLADLRRRVPNGVKWVRPEQVHVTVKFYGAVPAARIEQLEETLDRAARGVPMPRLTLTRAGTFPPRAMPRVVWLGLEDDGGALSALHTAVDRASEDLGYPRESRAFRPHLTLGRVRPPRSWSGQKARAAEAIREAIAPLEGRDFGACVVDELVLYRSELGREGPRYTAIGRYPIGPDAA